MTHNQTDDDLLIFAEETQTSEQSSDDFWHILIVDDEQDVHTTTTMVLADFEFESKRLKFTSAYSADEALAALKADNTIAVVLLDVVMEHNHAGLDLANIIRNEKQRGLTTDNRVHSQPVQAPESSASGTGRSYSGRLDTGA